MKFGKTGNKIHELYRLTREQDKPKHERKTKLELIKLRSETEIESTTHICKYILPTAGVANLP
jgi:hypothetical protein